MLPSSGMDALLDGFRQAFFDHTNVFLSSRAFFLFEKAKNNMKANNHKANKLAIPRYTNKCAQMSRRVPSRFSSTSTSRNTVKQEHVACILRTCACVKVTEMLFT